MSLAIWRFITLLLTGLVMGTSLCHVLEMPVKMQADGPLWTTLQHVLYRHFASVGGTVEIGAVLSAALLSHRVRGQPRAFRLTLLGAVFLAAAFVVWLWFVNPVNAETAVWSVQSIPAHWAARRAYWEYGHAVRFALHLIAFSALTLSVLLEARGLPAPRTLAMLATASVLMESPVQAGGRTAREPDRITAFRGWAMIDTVVSTHINAPPERVAALYAEYEGWPQVFPATIRGVRLLADDGQRKTIEVDHATEGKVINIMTAVSSREIRLEEFKRRFDARLMNRFEAAGEGTRYSIVADVRLKGAARALGPLVTPIVRARLNRFVLEPMRAAVEGGRAAREDRRLD
jgi:hypothetical protein